MKKGGFTLVEILIVAAIVGLLVVFGVPFALNAYSLSKEKVQLRNIADVETAKRMLTLPDHLDIPGAMGLKDTSLIIQNDPVALSNLCEALSIETLDELDVRKSSISVGTLLEKAFYKSSFSQD